jgi:hypothetical protein
MKQLNAIRKLFDELGKGEPLSPCCAATVFQDFSTCVNCGNIVPVPMYLASNKPVPDGIAIEKEKQLRTMLPVGSSCVCLVLIEDFKKS